MMEHNQRELRVREKLLQFGAHTLSDVELLTAFISTGSGQRSCTQVAQDMVRYLGDLRMILNADLKSFRKIHGLGMVRYVQLQAGREICRRSDFLHLQKEKALTNAQETYTFLKRQLRDKKNETFAALFLDSQHRVLAYEELFTGTIDTASIHPRPIIERILHINAAALILAHNHPSGESLASPQDYAVTTRLQEAFALMDVRLLDHLVIGDNEVYSILHATKWACH
jgi:DNA repair protein RadC